VDFATWTKRLMKKGLERVEEGPTAADHKAAGPQSLAVKREYPSFF